MKVASKTHTQNMEERVKPKSYSKERSIQTQTRNVNQEFTDGLNLPDNAHVQAKLTKKSPRVFETKVMISLWRESIFCKAIAKSPILSLSLAKRKIVRLVSDLHDRKFVTRKHMKPKFEKASLDTQITEDPGVL